MYNATNTSFFNEEKSLNSLNQISILSEDVNNIFSDHENYLIEYGIMSGTYTDFEEGEMVEKIKNSLSKLWEKIMEFFTKTNRYIKEILHGRIQGLNCKLEKSSIIFYNKSSKMYELEFSPGDLFTCVDVEGALNLLTSLTKDIEKSSKQATNNSSNKDDKKKDEFKGLSVDKNSTGNPYADIREKIIKEDVKISELSKYVNGINRYYNKAINVVYDVSLKAKKNAKTNNKEIYREFVSAKNITNSLLSVKNLIRLKEA